MTTEPAPVVASSAVAPACRARVRRRRRSVGIALAGTFGVAVALTACAPGPSAQATRLARPAGRAAELSKTVVAPAPGLRTLASPRTAPALRVDDAAAATNWSSYDRTAGRSGVSVSTPAPTHILRSWTLHTDGAVYAQPLVVGSEVLIATEDDTVYAVDRTTGATTWVHHLAAPVTSGLPCGDISPSGITGTPVADVAANRLWVVTFSDPGGDYAHTLWSLDLTTGAVESHRAIDGPGSTPQDQQERGALTLDGSRVFVPFGGLDGDCANYHGWVVGAPVSGRGALVSFVTPTQREAGIWAPPGPVVGTNGLYVATGNGTPYTAVDDSDSVLRLSPTDLRLLGRFTPSNYEQLSSGDVDLGTTSPAILPGGLVFMIGKQGVGYVLDANRLGGTGGQLASAPVCDGAFGGDLVDGDTVDVSCFGGLYSVRVTPGRDGHAPSIKVVWSVTDIAPGPPIMAGGIVWDVTRNGNQLVGYAAGTGRLRFSEATASPQTSFPSLSAAGTRLFVPEGNEVVSYRDV